MTQSTVMFHENERALLSEMTRVFNKCECSAEIRVITLLTFLVLTIKNTLEHGKEQQQAIKVVREYIDQLENDIAMQVQ